MYIKVNAKMIHSLCREYANGSKEAAERLLDLFNSVVDKLMQIITFGNVIKGGAYNLFYKGFKNKPKSQSNAETARYIQLSLRKYDPEDVRHEIIVVLLSTFMKAAKKKEIVVAYLIKTFILNLSQRLKKMIQVAPSQREVICEEVYDTPSRTPYNDILNDVEVFDKDLFLSGRLRLLTKQELDILVMKYLYNMTDEEIGEEMLLHRVSVNDKRRKALEKIGYRFRKIELCKKCGEPIFREVNPGPGRPPLYCERCRGEIS